MSTKTDDHRPSGFEERLLPLLVGVVEKRRREAGADPSVVPPGSFGGPPIPTIRRQSVVTTGRGRWIRKASIAAALIAVAAASVVLAWPDSQSLAYAGWTPRPARVSPDLRERITELCNLEPAPEAPAEPNDELLDSILYPNGPVIVDRRGNGLFALFAAEQPDGILWSECALIDTERGLEFVSGAEGIGRGVAPSSQGAPLTVDGGASQTADPIHTVLHGRVADFVARVVVIPENGIEVEAIVENGYFFAWWPTKDEARTARAYGADGGVVAEWDS